MLCPLLFRLLGVWLLLSQLPRELSAQGSNTMRLCGHELVRAHIEICSKIYWVKSLNSGKPSLSTVPAEDTALPSINDDTETSNMTSESTPDFQEGVTPNDQLTKITQKRQSEAEDTSSSELKKSGLEKRSRRKRTKIMEWSNKCCFQGCTIQELANGC